MRRAPPSRGPGAGFRNLEAAGAKTIISLREHHDDLPLLEETKLNYLRIPMDAWDPEEAELVLFLTQLERILKDPDSVFLKRLDVARVRKLMQLAP